ncbi:hypothetical protein DFH08DRAFT_827951 [Mycena albidolilacea]|uniref:Uncharacterized protein n=1 Tax=Mycena albidolilacea TaxID=1033008 RepID=A0AAD6YX58_9AGAR|nr:hypothetical protein DFH08DRAFT_827951 [Mycena albidolilacea]
MKSLSPDFSAVLSGGDLWQPMHARDSRFQQGVFRGKVGVGGPLAVHARSRALPQKKITVPKVLSGCRGPLAVHVCQGLEISTRVFQEKVGGVGSQVGPSFVPSCKKSVYPNFSEVLSGRRGPLTVHACQGLEISTRVFREKVGGVGPSWKRIAARKSCPPAKNSVYPKFSEVLSRQRGPLTVHAYQGLEISTRVFREKLAAKDSLRKSVKVTGKTASLGRFWSCLVHETDRPTPLLRRAGDSLRKSVKVARSEFSPGRSEKKVVNEPHALGNGGKAEGWIWKNGYYMSLSAAKEAEYVSDYRAQLHRAYTDMEQWQEVEILGKGFHHPVQEFHKMEIV